ncbi:hypothetical protein [Phycicoccus flavus]|uniref:hypothetical protein n=1 Tax=Phycicoccus flavus TaxID=2502783 RepID=UPI000FEC1100|nr:hypothetical protein [Phycicoccus flavus]NHA68771.1 hypothetical protein [Phycicoccus flavus]
MSDQPRPDNQPQPLVQGFPRPGRLVEHAYWELTIAATGTPVQVKALGDLRRLPRPWDPPTCTHPDLRLELWMWLEDVTTWINHEYNWDPDTYIPTCWPNHPHLVHDLAVLADQRRRAGMANTSDALEDWHRYALPTFHDRMRERLKTHCDNGHQPWPSTSRHARHTSDPHHRRRIHTYTIDARFDAPQDLAPVAPSARLRVVDGEVLDQETGEVLE